MRSDDGVVAFDLIGQTFGACERAELAAELGVDVSAVGGAGGMTLAHDVRDEAEVALLFGVAARRREPSVGAEVGRRAP